MARVETIHGARVASPALTGTGKRLFLLYVGAPLVFALFLLDLAVWAFAELFFDRCVALWCWF